MLKLKQVIFTREILARLAENGRASRDAGHRIDHKPVVRIFDPCGLRTWLFTESDPDEPDLLYGVFDDEFHESETGFVLRSDIETMTSTLGGALFALERDLNFTPKLTLSEYAKKARSARRLVE